jgi:hypothetical protein
MIDDYFANFNSIIPLFDESRFRAMFQTWTRHSDHRGPIAWASINVILALALQYRATSLLLTEPYGVETFIYNAQYVMSDLVSQEGDLRCIQVLVALAMLFQGNRNHQSSSVLCATAMKLAHRMKLHRRHDQGSMEDDCVSERTRVFWILYTLDREISIRGREPYLHRDCDIEIELPGTANQGALIGVVHRNEGAWFNLFQARVHLARVQGSIYDWTYSTNSENVQPEERRRNERCLSKALHDWQQSIPDEFRYDHLDGTLPIFITRQLVLLYFDYFHSVFRAHRVYSDDAAWIGRLTQYSDRYAGGYKDPITDMSCNPLSSENHNVTMGRSLLPEDWGNLVKIARACIALFREVDQHDTTLLR